MSQFLDMYFDKNNGVLWSTLKFFEVDFRLYVGNNWEWILVLLIMQKCFSRLVNCNYVVQKSDLLASAYMMVITQICFSRHFIRFVTLLSSTSWFIAVQICVWESEHEIYCHLPQLSALYMSLFQLSVFLFKLSPGCWNVSNFRFFFNEKRGTR